MNTPRHSGCRSVRIWCLLTIGATILPLTLSGQAPSTGHVWVHVGVSGARATAPPPALGASFRERLGLLLRVIRRAIVPKDNRSAVSRRDAAVVAVHASGDTVSLQVYLPTAHHVAVAGDMTDWHQVSMVRQQGGWWGVALPFSGSVSRIHMQSDDGEWQPVPGLPKTRDEYGDGAISLLVVPQARSGSPPE